MQECEYRQKPNICPLWFPIGDYGKELLLTKEDVQEQLKLDEEMMKLRNEQCEQCKKHFEEGQKVITREIFCKNCGINLGTASGRSIMTNKKVITSFTGKRNQKKKEATFKCPKCKIETKTYV